MTSLQTALIAHLLGLGMGVMTVVGLVPAVVNLLRAIVE
ncbi:hypothetical protein BH11PSE4_BH11PSE4_07860 [soil metagenome]